MTIHYDVILHFIILYFNKLLKILSFLSLVFCPKMDYISVNKNISNLKTNIFLLLHKKKVLNFFNSYICYDNDIKLTDKAQYHT